MYGLRAQIDHKVRFIRDHVPPDVSLILIGHSIGCYMILNMLEQLPSSRVLRCFMLFPTIERMAVSPNGVSMTPLLRYLRWLIVAAALLLVVLPEEIRKAFIRFHFRKVDVAECLYKGVLHTLTPWTANFTTYLARIEMGQVTELQKDLVSKHLRKLSFYYGASDQWAPAQFYYELMTAFPEADARLCNLNLKHAFVISKKESKSMAEILWQWTKSHQCTEFPDQGINNSEYTAKQEQPDNLKEREVNEESIKCNSDGV